MPARHSIKVYAPGTIHHVYNRGVEKRPIFRDHQDRMIFLGLLARYLKEPMPETPGRYIYKNYFGEILIQRYCLRKNHLHLLVNQVLERSMEGFMRSLMNSYVRYFNKRHNRVGPLFQGCYKARLITSDEDLINVGEYIDDNAREEMRLPGWKDEYASLVYYEAGRFPSWLEEAP